MSSHEPRNQGLRLRGELHSTNASAGVELPLFEQGSGNSRHVAPLERVELVSMSLVTAVGGDSYLFEDLAGIEVAVGDASTSADTLTLEGDATRALAVGDSIYVYGSTGNDGELTITAISYDATTNETTLSFAAVANGTGDGKIAWVYYAIAAADATGNTFTVAGDVRGHFPVGRLFIVDGSTGNDASGADYTVTATSYDSVADETTISVSSVADGTDDGFIILQATPLAGKYFIRGTYAANGGRSDSFAPQSRMLEAGHTLYCVAPSGVSDFESYGWLQRNLTRTDPLPPTGS